MKGRDYSEVRAMARTDRQAGMATPAAIGVGSHV
jgi:hypothetical protein